MEEILRKLEVLKMIKATQAWAMGNSFHDISRERHEIALQNHREYFKNIPFYQKHCLRNNATDDVGFEQILDHLMITDDYFKSYSQSLIDNKDFEKLSTWVNSISFFDSPRHSDSELKTASGNESKSEPKNDTKIDSIDDWFEQMASKGINVVFSSGTSGQMSFVPRDPQTWKIFLELPLLYMPLLAAQKGVFSKIKKSVLLLAVKLLSPMTTLRLIRRVGLRDYDGFFLGFKGGNQGIQLAGAELAKLTAKSEFLYPIKMTPQAVRAIIKKSEDPADVAAAEEFLKNTVWDKNQNYIRILSSIENSIERGQKILVFGTPYLILEICEHLRKNGKRLRPKHGSQVMFGGGWKSFSGEKVTEEVLKNMISEFLGISIQYVSEGYSMTEIQGMMVKCKYGRFHVPPFLEIVLFDESLKRKPSDSCSGTLGIIDPFAFSYPGFLITGDDVNISNKSCACGIKGVAIEKVERTPGKEVKGCGGIMASVNA